MASFEFSWLDYSEQDRRRMQDFIDQLGSPDTVDELGLGVIRDSLADLLFPGTTTIQTRARYFLFVPWMYVDLERRSVPTAEIARKAHGSEIDLIHNLLNNGCAEGTIGARAKDKLKRMPSNVYWRGLRLWQICLFDGSQEEYHASLDRFYEMKRNPRKDDDGELLDGSERNWHSGIPKPPDGFPKNATHDLSRVEAEYLRERIITSHPGTMLAFLVDGDAEPEAEFPWLLPSLATMSADVNRIAEHARNFSYAMHGASLIYNLMLSEKAQNEEWTCLYKDEISTWATAIQSLRPELQRWDRLDFRGAVLRGGGHIDLRTDAFVNWWLDLVLGTEEPAALAISAETRDRIIAREISLKGRLARLGLRGVEDYNGAAGAQQISYRWWRVKILVSDILVALSARKTREGAHA